MFGASSSGTKRTLESNDVESNEIKQPKLEISDGQSVQKVENQEDEAEQIARQSVDEQTIRRFPEQYYYHYTSEINLNMIKKDGYLQPGTPSYARKQEGIYVTTMDPFRNSGTELRNYLFRGGGSWETKSKLQSYVALKKANVSRACSLVKKFGERPKCLRLVARKRHLFLKEVELYAERRMPTGNSDAESD